MTMYRLVMNDGATTTWMNEAELANAKNFWFGLYRTIETKEFKHYNK